MRALSTFCDRFEPHSDSNQNILLGELSFYLFAGVAGKESEKEIMISNIRTKHYEHNFISDVTGG